MEISKCGNQQRKSFFFLSLTLQAILLILFLYLKFYNNKSMSPAASSKEISFQNLHLESTQSLSSNRKVTSQRLPDVIIVGVKKSGTITLINFLNYHPSIAAAGEISFFERGKLLRVSKKVTSIYFQIRCTKKELNITEEKCQRQGQIK